MSVLKIEKSGSFHETYAAGSLPPLGSGYPDNTIFPIWFAPIFSKSMQTWEQRITGVYPEDWTEKFKQDYIFATTFEITSLIAFYELPSKLLAGFVNIEDDDSDGIKAQKLMDNYSRFQKVGLKLWIRQEPVWRSMIAVDASPIWIPTGETILQNKGVQMKINLLPYLGATVFDIFSGAIGFSIIDKGNGKFGGADYLTVIGEWKYTLTAFPKVIGAINLVETFTPQQQ